MSVINKMLRDLDQRQTGGVASKTEHDARVALGTVPLAAMPATAHPAAMQRRLAWGSGLLLAVAVAGGAWYVQSGHWVSNPSVAVAVSTPAVSITAPAIAAAPLVSAPVVASSMPSPVAAVSAVPVQALASRVLPDVRKLPTPPLATKPTPELASVTDPAGGAQFLRMDSALSKVPSKTTLNATQAAGGRSASDDLTHAQSLWNAGSRVAAMELLQQALSQVEAASATAGPVTGQSTLARLARELARMNLAEGQANQALALLTRLEPQLFQIADVWAMRGNAAQRLGQHAEAVKSYQQALRLKPDETRWMMGQAVSLAAQGQLSAAGELAEMTRVLGALQPEVANYLRQLGVTVRMD